MRYLLLIGTLLLLSFRQVVWADGWQVVVRSDASVSWLDRDHLYTLFMGSGLGGTAVQIVDAEDETERAQFYQQVLGFSVNRWRAHWARLVFTGQGTPPMQLNYDELLTVLAHSSQVVAYLPLQIPLPSGTKRIFMYTEDDASLTSCRRSTSCSDQQLITPTQ
jgi:hypothetical protein